MFVQNQRKQVDQESDDFIPIWNESQGRQPVILASSPWISMPPEQSIILGHHGTCIYIIMA